MDSQDHGYADRLEAGLEGLDWPEGTLTAQKQWIGKSEGCQIKFNVEGHPERSITAFTTRADTLMGVTYVTLAPEHPLVGLVTAEAQKEAVDAYVRSTSSRSDRDRMASKEKTGVFTGGYVRHPLTQEKVPIWVADYVLGSYGTGVLMYVRHGSHLVVWSSSPRDDIIIPITPPLRIGVFLSFKTDGEHYWVA